MNCEKCLYFIDDFVEGELDEQAAGQVNSHLFACSQCREQYETLKREKEIYGHYLFDAEPPKDLWTSFQTRLEAEKEKTVLVSKTPVKTKARKTNIFGFLRLYPVLAAAALLVVFGIGFAWLRLAVIETGNDKYVAKMETGVSKLLPSSESADKGITTESPKKIENGENDFARKNDNLGKSESLKAKSVSVADKKSAVAESVKIERKTISEAVKIERKTVPIIAAKNSVGENRPSEEERLQNARLRNLEREIAGQIEKVELLLRSFRNARAIETIKTFDIEYEKGQARRLLDKNARLRREAENYGVFYAEELLSRIEPYLLDIANLESNPVSDKVLDIQERVKNQNIIASLQIY